MGKYRQTGSSHIVIVLLIVVAIIGGLGYAAYQRFFVKRDTAGTTMNMPQPVAAPAQQKDEVIEGPGVMNTYINHQFGFSFQYPAKIVGQTDCYSTNQWRDNYGNIVTAPVTLYGSHDGPVGVTILKSANKFTITQTTAPMFTEASYGTDRRMYFSDCKMVDTTQELINQGELDGLQWRAWQVYKIDSEDQIPKIAQEFDGAPLKEYVTSVDYKLGQIAGGRQSVDIHYILNREGTGGSAMVTWYYPKQKLLVHINMGQSESFQDVKDSNKFYGQDILASFKAL